MTKIEGKIECPHCGKMTGVKGKTLFNKYTKAVCEVCNEGYMYLVKTINGIVK